VIEVGAAQAPDEGGSTLSLLNHFFKLRAEHIHLPAYKIATKCNVKPVSLLTFHDEFVGLSDFSDVRAHTGREGRSAIN